VRRHLMRQHPIPEKCNSISTSFFVSPPGAAAAFTAGTEEAAATAATAAMAAVVDVLGRASAGEVALGPPGTGTGDRATEDTEEGRGSNEEHSREIYTCTRTHPTEATPR